MTQQEQVNELIPLLTFIPKAYVHRFAGALIKRYGYEFLADELDSYDPTRAHSKTIPGYFAAIEDWQKPRLPEWKAGQSKKEDTEDIRNALFKKDFKTADRLTAKLNAQGYS